MLCLASPSSPFVGHFKELSQVLAPLPPGKGVIRNRSGNAAIQTEKEKRSTHSMVRFSFISHLCIVAARSRSRRCRRTSAFLGPPACTRAVTPA
jgi:hypothetical protein